MRRLAEVCGVRAPSLYRHFADQDAILQALAEEAARLMLARLARTRSFAGALDAYQAFAHEEAPLYDLLLLPVAAAENIERKKLWQYLLRLVAPLSGDEDDTAAAVAIWSFLHGYCALRQSGAFGASGPREGFARGVEILARGLPPRGGTR